MSKHLDLFERLRAEIAQVRVTSQDEMRIQLTDLEQVLNESMRAAGWAAMMMLELGRLSGLIDDVQGAVLKHPKFDGKTALVWRHELDELFLENHSARYPARIPKLEEAVKTCHLIALMDRISRDPELMKRFEDVRQEFLRIDKAEHHPSSSVLNPEKL